MSGKKKSPAIRVEVTYALRERQALIALDIEEGATVREAIAASGVLRQFPEIDLASVAVGIFGRIASLDALLKDGDRVEIYRSLVADAKEMRRERLRRRTRTPRA